MSLNAPKRPWLLRARRARALLQTRGCVGWRRVGSLVRGRRNFKSRCAAADPAAMVMVVVGMAMIGSAFGLLTWAFPRHPRR